MNPKSSEHRGERDRPAKDAPEYVERAAEICLVGDRVPQWAAEHDQDCQCEQGDGGQQHEHDRGDPKLPEGSRFLVVVRAIDGLDHRAHRATRGPDGAGSADHECEHLRAAALVALQSLDERDHAVRCNRREEGLHLVVEMEHAEQPEQERGRGEEREQRAVGHLTGEPRAVVREELPERSPEDGDPLGEHAACVPGFGRRPNVVARR